MNEYRVGVALSEGVVLVIKAENENEAKKAVEELVNEEGGSAYELPFVHTHRDFHIVDVQEIKE